MLCAACGAAAPPRARFCPACGAALVARADERRVVTVLFADLVGFTGLSERMDPEQVKNLVDGCFSALVGDVVAFGGQLDKIVGDAVVALFGAAVAHEDDAERAVRAALRMQQTLAAQTAPLEVDVRMRVGVNTGEVLVGALTGGGTTAMGDVVNTASRLQNLAPPGSVVVGPATYAATRHVVDYEALGPLRARGREDPIDAYLARGVLGPPGFRPRRRRAPLVGRDTEVALVGRAVDLAVLRRRALAVSLVGEAGVGKSRLAEALARQARVAHDALVLEGRCLPYGEANVWWPLAEIVRQGCGVDLGAEPEEAAGRVRDAVAAALGRSASPAEVTRVAAGLGHLLGLSGPVDAVDPARAREESQRALATWLEGLCRAQPVVVCLGDLDWADESVLDVARLLLGRLGARPFVLLSTARAARSGWPPVEGRHSAVALAVDPLDRASAQRLLEDLTDEPDGGARPWRATEAILDRAGGNPLFLEELAALVRAGDPEPAPVPDLPDTLRGLVVARLDLLEADERAVLDDASVLGRSGPVEALRLMAVARGRPDLDPVLEQLAAGEVLLVDGDRWRFGSELVREVAYSTLTKAQRARRHAAIGAYLESRGDPVEGAAGQIAHHFASAAELARELAVVGDDPLPGVPADLGDRAVAWIERAATRSEERDPPAVALRWWERALGLARPDADPVRHRRLLLGRAAARAGLHDLAGARADLVEVLEATQEPALVVPEGEDGAPVGVDRDAARGVSDSSLVLRGVLPSGRGPGGPPGAADEAEAAVVARAVTLWGELAQRRGDLHRASGVLSDAVARWKAVGDRRGEGDALRRLGMVQLFLGDHVAAEATLVRAQDAFVDVGDVRGEAWALHSLAWVSFDRRDTSVAEARLAVAADRFRSVGDLGGLGWVSGLLAWVRYAQDRLGEAEQLALEVGRDARERGDRWGEATLAVLVALVRLANGLATVAAEQGTRARDLFESLGDAWGTAQALAVRARALAASGRVDDAEDTLGALGALARRAPERGVRATAGLAEAMVAVALGEPDRALRALGGTPGGDVPREVTTTAAVAHLQRGEADVALALLGDRPTDAARRAVQALALAAVGRADDAATSASLVASDEAATYLHRGLARAAAGLARARAGRGAEALAALAEARRALDATEDRIGQAVARVAEAVALEALSSPSAGSARIEAADRLRALGIGAGGWEVALRAAAGLPTPLPASAGPHYAAPAATLPTTVPGGPTR